MDLLGEPDSSEKAVSYFLTNVFLTNDRVLNLCISEKIMGFYVKN